MTTSSIDLLLAWLHEPDESRGIRFGRFGEDWELWTYARLTRFAHRVACGLVEAGVRQDDIVSIVERSGPEFVATLFGTMLAGATPSPIAPPAAFQDPVVYAEYVEGLLRLARPAVVVSAPDVKSIIDPLAARAGLGAAVSVETLVTGIDEGVPAPGRRRPHLALLQFTSGSSGRARGVRVPFSALTADVDAIRRWLEWNDSDALASWLPIHHDMGLVGCVITPVASRSNLWLLSPEEFIRDPLRYLECFGRFGASITATPNFGLDYIVRRIREDMLAGFDFSGWHGIIVGAERIDPHSLERFYELLRPFGLRRSYLRPAYGLAEATLAVTGLPMRKEWSAVAVEPSSLTPGGRLAITADASGGAVVVGCGRPLPGLSVEIVDEEGRCLGEGRVGEIVVEGPTLAEGYLGSDDSLSLTSFSDATLRTGDAGFLLNGELFVLGRLGDSLKIRGRTVFAEDLEAALGTAGLPRHRVATLLGVHLGVPTVVALLEQPDDAWLPEANALLRRRTEGAAVVLLDTPRGTIVRTSSGKPKRRQLWQAFIDGGLPGQVVARSTGTTVMPAERTPA